MNTTPEQFVHRFIPAPNTADAPTLLVLHGTGGNENDLIPLAQMLVEDVDQASLPNILSPRGRVLENGMPRFFRRLAEGVFDLEDLQLRTHELADFINQAAATYNFDLRRVVAVGYSNGANIAAALLLLRPETLAAAVLFRPMVPLVPKVTPDLSAKPIFIAAGRTDPIVRPEQTEKLADMLRRAGAQVELHWQAGGHNLGREEIDQAKRWTGVTKVGSRKSEVWTKPDGFEFQILFIKF